MFGDPAAQKSPEHRRAMSAEAARQEEQRRERPRARGPTNGSRKVGAVVGAHHESLGWLALVLRMDRGSAENRAHCQRQRDAGTGEAR